MILDVVYIKCTNCTMYHSTVGTIKITKGAVMITIDTRSRVPIYTQLEKQIIKLINLGVYETDSPLPSVRSMACELGINPNTVAKAYKGLEQQGIIYTVTGKGIFVGSTDLSKVHQLTIKTVKNALVDAKNSGIEKSAIEEIVNKIWEGSK